MLSDHFVLKGQRADVPVCTVPPGSIVVNFNILEYGPAHVIPRGEALTVDDLHLEGVEEAFGDRVILAIAFAAHAAN